MYVNLFDTKAGPSYEILIACNNNIDGFKKNKSFGTCPKRNNLCKSDKNSICYDSIVNTYFVLQKGRKPLINTSFPLYLLPDNATWSKNSLLPIKKAHDLQHFFRENRDKQVCPDGL
jgi:hypothetical protein